MNFQALLAGILYPPVLFAFGFAALRLLRIRRGETLSDPWHYLTAFTIGMILFSFSWLCLGTWVGVDRILLGLILLLGTGLGIIYFRDYIALTQSFSSWTRTIWADSTLNKVLCVQLVLIVLVTFARCFAFYIEGDSLVYHLYLPKLYVLLDRIQILPFSEHAAWPALLEMGFIPGELLHSLALSKWFSYLFYILMIALVGIWVAQRTAGPRNALIAMVVLAGSPVIFFHAPSSYNDLAFGYFLALAVILYPLAGQAKRQVFPISFLAGLFFGASLSTKYLAFFGALYFGVVFGLDWLRSSSRGHSAKGFAVFLIGAALTGLPYYVRSLIAFRNPVFPFAQGIFKTSFGYGLETLGMIGSNLSDFRAVYGREWLDYLLLPWRLTFLPDAYGGDHLGLHFLLLSFLIFWAWKQNKRILLFIFIFSVTWFSLSQYTRYLIPVFILLAGLIGLGYGNFAAHRPKAGRVIIFVVILMTTVSNLWAGYHAYKDFWIRKPAEIQKIAEWMNHRISRSEDRALVLGDERLYYYDFTAYRERTFRNFTFYPDNSESQYVTHLMEKHGIQYLIMIRHPGRDRGGAKTDFDPIGFFDNLIKRGFFKPLGEGKLPSGVQYELYLRQIARPKA